jgi:hypothetical protein
MTWPLCSVGVFAQRKLQLISPNYRFNLKIVVNAFVLRFENRKSITCDGYLI